MDKIKLFDTASIKDFPEAPGVYLMKGARGEVLYVGKAKNLKARVRQYFLPGGDGRPMIPFLLPKVADVQTLVVRSEKEALLLEANFIKQHKPRYNALLKDDKSYIALKITRHKWPRIDLVRYRGKPKKDGLYFGPYTNAGSARRTLDLIHKIFPMRQCSDEEFARRTRPCILYDMKRCVAPCVKLCTEEQYENLVKKTARFLRGQDKEILHELYSEMEHYSNQLEFEKAKEVHEKIRHIEKTVEKQIVDRPFGEDVDAIGIFRQADEVMVVILYYRSGRLMGSRHFHLSKIIEDDQELISSLIVQIYHENPTGAKELLLPVRVENPEVLSELAGISVHTPQKGVLRAYIEMAEMNAEAFFMKEKDKNALLEKTLLEMKDRLGLERYPMRIECFDTSHLFGDEAVASLVAFTAGKKDTSRYRKYKIGSAKKTDDYEMLREVLSRRLVKGQKEGDLPDLLIVDGGKGQLNIARKVLQEINIITVAVISLAKEKGLHTRGATQEQIFLPGIKDPILLSRHSPLLFFLQKIRDEAHRFAIGYHRKKREKQVRLSLLDQVAGIGPVKKMRLLRRFGSVKRIFEASAQDLASVPGISAKDIENLLAFNPPHEL